MAPENTYLYSRKSLKQKGLALIVVLWILSLLMIMAASFSLTISRETSVIIGIKNNARANAGAEAGVAIAQMMLLNPDQIKRWRSDGSIYQIQFGDVLVRIRMLSESGKININRADQKQLQNLMEKSPVDPEQRTALVSAIMDWRDPDDLTNIDGAEKEEYEEADLKYRPRNKPFQTIEELQMVLGMSESILTWLEPKLTVYANSASVDYSQASKEVLLTIPGVEPELIDQYIELRRQSAIKGVPVPPFALGPVQTSFSGQESNAVEVISEAQLDDGSSAAIKVVLAKSLNDQSTPFRIMNWKTENNDSSLFSEDMSAFLVTQQDES